MAVNRTMTHRVEALSMSWRVARALRQEGWSGEVLAAHSRSCYLVDEDGAVCAVVPESLGNGPLHVVIPASPSNIFQDVSTGVSVASTGKTLRLGEILEVGLDNARLWDPKPYPSLGADPDGLRRAVAVLYQAATSGSPAASLAHLLPHLKEEELPAPLQKIAHFPRSHALMSGLAESLGQRNRRGLKVVTSSMAGLGPGLTPAGDDFLAGVLLALAVVQEHRADAELTEIAGMLLETAAPRTHEISAAYLKAAHAGEANERWHRLLGAVAAGDSPGITDAAGAVMEIGETSGADMLAGFLTGIQALHGW